MQIQTYAKNRELVEVIVPAGEYVVGDPCHVVPDEYWSDSLSFIDRNNMNPVCKTADGVEFLAFSTERGDGCFDTSIGFFPVDAGLIGLVPLDAVKRWVAQGKIKRFDEELEVILVMDEPTLCTNENGDMWFGDANVDTRVQNDEDEDEDENENEDEDDE